MKTLTVAIVGHTNTGKTSLIRSLTHDRNFGEVRDEASTTLEVNEIALASDTLQFHFFDTPGLEDSMGILEELAERSPIEKIDEPKRLHQFCQDSRMMPLFEQEIKVIKQLFQSDLTLYVIDTRLPFLPKFDDELSLILQTHKPILPILNFLSTGEYLDQWKRELKARGLHHYLEFDTIVPPQKRRLYEQIAIMFPDYYSEIQQFIALHEAHQKELFQQALVLVANFYLNLLTLQIKLPKESKTELIQEKLEKQVAKIERQSIDQLLKLYQFNREDVELLSLNLNTTRFEPNFFTSDNLVDFSMQFSKGATVGAGVFAGVDALAGFTTLGAATATGAILGGIGSSLKHYSSQIMDHLNDRELFVISDHAIFNLTARMLSLLGLLNGRSHADLTPILLDDQSRDEPLLTQLLEQTAQLRAYANYSEFNSRYKESSGRVKALTNIERFFQEHYQSLYQVR